jgi:hypothetical protein
MIFYYPPFFHHEPIFITGVVMIKSPYRPIVLLFLICLYTRAVDAQIISGSASILLNGPATKEQTLEAEIQAQKKLRIELLHWLEDEVEITVDTSNAVSTFSFAMFLDSCRTAAKTETSFHGKQLTLAYILTAETVQKEMEEYNKIVDNAALKAWNNLSEAFKVKDLRAVYVNSVKGLYFSRAHFGPPMATPDRGGRDLDDDFQRVLQKFYDKTHITSSGMILSGKTGLTIKNPPSVTVIVDSLPFTGMTLSGRLQDGTILFSDKTDENGKLTVNTFRIPFVANGALMDIYPNPAPVLGITGFINPEDFGIKFNHSQVQSFIFKIISPVYKLKYQAQSVSNITLPPEFADEARVRKFLRDSCFLKEKSDGAPVDLDISIKTQVSSYTFDETEEISIKVSSEIIVNGLLLKPPRKKVNEMVFEKRYGRYQEIPYGLYFWEANSNWRKAIKATIAGL